MIVFHSWDGDMHNELATYMSAITQSLGMTSECEPHTGGYSRKSPTPQK